MFNVPTSGGVATQITPPLPVGRDFHDFDILPDSSAVVYQADQETDKVDELFSVSRGSPGVVDALFSDRFE